MKLRTHQSRSPLRYAAVFTPAGTNLGDSPTSINQALSAQVLTVPRTVAAHFSGKFVTVAVVMNQTRQVPSSSMARAGGSAAGSTNEAVRANAGKCRSQARATSSG